MKYIVNKTGLLSIAVFLMFSIAGCRGDHPPQTEGSQGFDDRKMDEAKNIPALKHAPNIPVLKHAPDWVNKGSDFLASGDKRYFIGVGYSAPVGDMALQKSVADDMARAEVERALAFFQNALAKNYLLADSNSISKVKQGGDERATKTVHVARLGASDLLAGSCPLRSDSVVGEEANAVSPMKWNWNKAENAGEVDAPVLQLREQATQLAKDFPQAVLGSRLRLFAANGLEQEARAAEVQVRRWLLAGKSSIAIVAQDRLAARRVRALLERAEVQVRDESGWILSTMAVSTVLMRWLDALQSDFYYQDMLDLLKSPYIFADQPAAERKQIVYQLEQLLRKHGAVAHLDVFFELARNELPELGSTLARLRQAAAELTKKSNTLNGWLLALERSLAILGVSAGLAADAAGVQMLQSLHTWQQELAADGTRYTRGEWRHWLALQLDRVTWRDSSIDSPVLITHLAATRWRKFDAVLLLGCDAAHLPSADNVAVWFNDAVRDTLGLPVRAVYRAQQRDDLLALLAMNDTVLATWQASKNGVANLLSPYLEILRDLHQLAYQDDLAENELAGMLEAAQVRSDSASLPDSTHMPLPIVPSQLIPQRISASGYNSLVACPYQYYARHVLHLNELDEIREDIEKRDFGEWVHDILHRFHQQFNVLGGHEITVLEKELSNISVEVFAQAVQRDYWARAWLLRWQQSIPAYIEAQLNSEAEGWRYQNGEVAFELPVTEELLMRGRIDRIDVQGNAASVVRVLDYKTQNAAKLKAKLKQAGEDVQLPFYAHVFEATEAAFISIEKNKVLLVEPPQDVSQLAHANIERLKQVFLQMRSGTPLPANGIGTVCEYCEMRGLCRKAEWA